MLVISNTELRDMTLTYIKLETSNIQLNTSVI